MLTIDRLQPLPAQTTVSRPTFQGSPPHPEAALQTVMAPRDQLVIKTPTPGTLRPPASIFKGVFDAPVAPAAPAQRTMADYEKIFNWVETVTGKPIAYQDDRSKAAYLAAIKGKPQDYYDTKGFLNGIGVHGAETYGRDDSGVHALLKTIRYSPNSEEVSLPLRLAQKSFFWFFKTFPKTFGKIADLTDKYYFTRKDTKAQSWLNVKTPQPGLNLQAPILPPTQVKARYQGNLLSRNLNQGLNPSTQQLFDKHFLLNPPAEIGLMFEEDFHMGVPKDGETPHNYGTYAIALRLGFNEEQARNFGTANYGMDLNNTAYGPSDAFPNALPSKHFNLNKANTAGGDTRFVWAQKHLDAAVELARRGEFTQAEQEVGYGLHSIQDAFAHGHIRLASHAITDNIPDGVDYNPVGAYEATLATVGYLKAYMERISAL